MGDPHYQRIMEQQDKFNAELPSLLEQYPGKWALYLDGVQGIYDNDDTARRAAIKRYGLNVTYLIAPIEERKPPVPAWKLGGMGAAAVYEQLLAKLQAKHDVLAAENTRLRSIVDAAIANLDARRALNAAPRITRECDTGKISFPLPFDHPLWRVVTETMDRMDALLDALKEQ